MTNSSCIAKFSILKYEGTIKKNSYEHRDYESVDEKSLSYRVCAEKRQKKISQKRVKGLLDKRGYNNIMSTLNINAKCCDVRKHLRRCFIEKMSW